MTDIGLPAVSGKIDQQHTAQHFQSVCRCQQKQLRVFANIWTTSQTEVSANFACCCIFFSLAD